MTLRSDAKPSSERFVPWVLLLVALGLSVWAARHGAARRAPQVLGVDPLSAVPAGPELLLTADVAELVSVARDELLSLGGAQLLGLRELCGFEPLLSLRRVALATPSREPAQQASDFALIAETALEPEAMLRCAEAVIRKRGGTALRSRLGQFWSVRDQRKPAGEVAVRSDGLFVMSGGSYLREVVDTAAGSGRADEAARLRSELHRSVRRELGTAELAVTLLPGAIMALPDVRAVGLALHLDAQQASLRGFVGCATAAVCSDVATLLESAKAGIAREPALAPLLAITLTRREARLELAGAVPREGLAPLVRALFEL